MNQSIQQIVKFWEEPRNIPFKGELISLEFDEPCMCAQGQVLRILANWEYEELQNATQEEADVAVAKLLDISIAQSILLRTINDSEEGAPGDVLSKPEKYLGPNYELILNFWRLIDRLTEEQWKVINEKYITKKDDKNFVEECWGYYSKAVAVAPLAGRIENITKMATLFNVDHTIIFRDFLYSKQLVGLVLYRLICGESALFDEYFREFQ